MAYSINSEEFAKAWRIVSESLLATLQSLDSSSIHMSSEPQRTDIAYDRPNHFEDVNTTKEVPAKTEKDTVFANCPISDGEGGFLFKNLKAEESDQSTFKIIRYTDDTAEFEIREDLSTEARQNLKDNLSNRLPSQVGSAEGLITEACKIINEVKGQGLREGRSIRIVSPLKVVFK